MARLVEFSSINVAKLLLGLFIFVVLVLAVGTWMFYSGASDPA
jgi:hypothetical protein